MGITSFANSAGCVVPPPLELDSPDAAPNSPPTLIEVRDDLAAEIARPGPLVVQADDPRTLTFTLADNDRGDTLYVSLFVDYNLPGAKPALDSCATAPAATPTTQRTVTCNQLRLLCPVGTDTSVQHLLEVLVSDRPIDPGGLPTYQAVTPPGVGVPYSWLLTCEAPPL